MKKTINRLVRKNYSLAIILGFMVAVGGIGLAYLTNDSDPWGTIGGVVCGLGLLFVFYASSINNG